MGRLVPLTFRPGFNREVTTFANEAGWKDGDKVRFRKGFPETIGGWQEFSSSEYLGTGRNLYAWTALDNTKYIGLGTHLKYYIIEGETFNDVTPIRATTAAGDPTFAATDTSSTITVTDTGHDAEVGDYVIFEDAVSLGGNVTADVLNQEYVIDTVVDANNYTITVGVVANASDSGDGGASTVATYLLPSGRDSAVLGTGYGAGGYGEDGYGDASASATGVLDLRTWSHDNFGEDLIINPRNENIYYWDKTSGTSTRAVALSDLSGADTPPEVATSILVSDQDRHIIAFGAAPFTDPTNQDPLLVRWSDQENAAEWTPSTTNTAGSIRLSSGSQIVTALQTKREILIFADTALYSMQFLGPPYTFGVQEIGHIGRLASPNAAVAVQDSVFWMENGRFMVYDGMIKELPCSVKEYVFSQIAEQQFAKVVGGHNALFSEVWWFYPTATENDRYVAYNYVEDLWYFGTMTRTAWLSSGQNRYPIAAATDNKLYYHEFGLNDGSTNPPQALNAFVESATTDIEEGNSFFFMNRVLPDLTFRTSSQGPMGTLTIKGRNFPGGAYLQEDDEDVSQVSAAPVERFTDQVHVRVRGRSFSFRFESNSTETAWRLGIPRVEVRTDGRR